MSRWWKDMHVRMEYISSLKFIANAAIATEWIYLASISEASHTKYHPIFLKASNHCAQTKVNDRRKMFFCAYGFTVKITLKARKNY